MARGNCLRRSRYRVASSASIRMPSQSSGQAYRAVHERRRRQPGRARPSRAARQVAAAQRDQGRDVPHRLRELDVGRVAHGPAGRAQLAGRARRTGRAWRRARRAAGAGSRRTPLQAAAPAPRRSAGRPRPSGPGAAAARPGCRSGRSRACESSRPGRPGPARRLRPARPRRAGRAAPGRRRGSRSRAARSAGMSVSSASRTPARSVLQARLGRAEVGTCRAERDRRVGLHVRRACTPVQRQRAPGRLGGASMSARRICALASGGQHHRVRPGGLIRRAAAPSACRSDSAASLQSALRPAGPRAYRSSSSARRTGSVSAGSSASASASSDRARSSSGPVRRLGREPAHLDPVQAGALFRVGDPGPDLQRPFEVAQRLGGRVRGQRVAGRVDRGGQRPRQVEGGVPVIGQRGGQRRLVAGQARVAVQRLRRRPRAAGPARRAACPRTPRPWSARAGTRSRARSGRPPAGGSPRPRAARANSSASPRPGDLGRAAGPAPSGRPPRRCAAAAARPG